MSSQAHLLSTARAPRRLRGWSWALLLVWLCSSQVAGPLLWQGALSLLGEHQLEACGSKNGEMRMVLGHAKHASGRTEHGPSQVQASSSDAQEDHVICLKAIEDRGGEARRLVSLGQQGQWLPLAWGASVEFRRPMDVAAGSRLVSGFRPGSGPPKASSLPTAVRQC